MFFSFRSVRLVVAVSLLGFALGFLQLNLDAQNCDNKCRNRWIMHSKGATEEWIVFDWLDCYYCKRSSQGRCYPLPEFDNPDYSCLVYLNFRRLL